MSGNVSQVCGNAFTVSSHNALNILPRIRGALCVHLGIDLGVCSECLVCFQLYSHLWLGNISFKDVTSLSLLPLFLVLCSRRPIPLFSLCNSRHPSFLTPRCWDLTRQTNVIVVWADRKGVALVSKMWQDSQTSTKKVTRPISLQRGWELPRQQISSVDEGGCWRHSAGEECVRACHLPWEQMSLVPVILM